MGGLNRQHYRKLVIDLTAFVGFRLMSGVLSFVLFATIARWYSLDETKSLYYFLFLMGFLMSALRALATLSASLHGFEPRSTKLRRVLQAYGHVLLVAALLLPWAWWMGHQTLAGPAWIYAGMTLVLVSWGLDVDILRAIVGRLSVVAAAGAGGALLAIACLMSFRSVEGAKAAILLQWLPICTLNVWVILRWRKRIIAAASNILKSGGNGLWGALSVALFDGLVINTPFFLGDATTAELGRSIGVVTRIFVASVILMPLLVYWSNGQSLVRLAVVIALPVPVIYGLLAAVTGLLAGAGFAWAFALIAAVAPTAPELMASATLLLAYVAYAVASRFWGRLRGRQLVWLLALAAFNGAGVWVAIKGPYGALGVASIQGLSLLAATLVILRRPPAPVPSSFP